MSKIQNWKSVKKNAFLKKLMEKVYDSFISEL